MVDDVAEKYVDTLNEFGQREAEWYLCVKDKKCLALWTLPMRNHPGYSEMMTSLTVPILRDNEFIGVAGVDLTLPVFQSMTEKLSKELCNGKARVTLLSSLDLVVGSSHYKDKLGRPLKEAVTKSILDNYVKAKKQSGVFKVGDEYLVNYPISIKLAKTQWNLLIEVPQSLPLKGPMR